MTDPLDALREPPRPVTPDPHFAARLRARLERALLDPPTPEDPMPTATVARPAAALHTVTPYLAVVDARAAVEFLVAAFGAARRDDPIMMPDGRVGHVEVAIGDSVVMMAEEFPEIGLSAPVSRGGPSQSLRVEVDDPDAVVAGALALGAHLDRPVADSPHGRGGVVLDPSGHRWMVAQESARPGDVVYASLWTPDTVAAQRFYSAVLGSVPNLHGMPGPSTLLLCYAVADLDAAVARVRAAGGTVGAPEDRPYGRAADGVDDQGLPFALHEGAAAPGREFGYVELRVPDAGRARAFYGTVLGWGFEPGGAAGYWHPRRADGGFTSPMTGLTGGHASAAAVPTFPVDDLDAATAAVRDAGGTSQPAGHSGGVACMDDQGTAFSLVQRV